MEIKNSIGLFILNGEASGIELLKITHKGNKQKEFPLFDLDIASEDLISIVYKLTDKLGIYTLTNEIALTHVVEKKNDDLHYEYQYWFTVVASSEKIGRCEITDIKVNWIRNPDRELKKINMSKKLKNNIKYRITNGWRAAPIDYINDSEEEGEE